MMIRPKTAQLEAESVAVGPERSADAFSQRQRLATGSGDR